MKHAPQPKSRISREEWRALFTMPPFEPPERLRNVRYHEDIVELEKLRQDYQAACLAKIRNQDQCAHNDAEAQPTRSNVALVVSSIAIRGLQQEAIFINPQTGKKTKPMSVGSVVKNLQDAYRAATKPFAECVKDMVKATARRKTSLENGDAYYKAAKQMQALEGVQPRQVVRFFRRRAKHLHLDV